MVKKNILAPTLLIVCIALVLSLGFVLKGSAATGDPGSPEDPLVTRSYVEALINTQLSGRIAEAVQDSARYSQWQVLNLEAGQTMEGKASTEFIVRAGKTVIVDPSGSGIPDVTAGANVRAGKPVPLDHLFIIPRTDGRGIVTQNKAIVMYKGEILVR